MARSSRKLTAAKKKGIARQRAISNREADTTYWLQFYPKEGISVLPEDLKSFWRIQLTGNPDIEPECIEKAESSFEFSLKISKWRDVADSIK